MPEDKVSESADKGAVSAKKAADTAEAYEQASGQTDTPASDSDPVMDSINEATADIEQPESQEAVINQEYEEQRAEAFENRETSEDEDDDEDDDTTVSDANHPEVGSHLKSDEAAAKSATKKTAAKKS